MKAVQFAEYGDPQVLQVYDVADPIPETNDVLMRVRATTVNRLDLFQRDGSRPVNKLPFTLGAEAVGEVLSNAQGFRVGERVMTTRALQAKGGGGYASRIAVPASDLVRIPNGVSFEEAVAAGLTASTAWAALFDIGALQEGERVLIWAGASGVGTFAIQLARQSECWIATTASNATKVKELQRLGANLVVNHREQDVGQAVRDAGGVNLVIELVSATLQASIEACNPGARVVLVGNLGGQKATVDTQMWRIKRLQVIGGSAALRTSVENEARILDLVAQKAVTPIVERIMPVEQAAEAHRLLASGEPVGKIVLIHD